MAAPGRGRPRAWRTGSRSPAGNGRKRARLNCIAHLPSVIPYGEVPHEPVALPRRVVNPDDHRAARPCELQVPDVSGPKAG